MQVNLYMVNFNAKDAQKNSQRSAKKAFLGDLCAEFSDLCVSIHGLVVSLMSFRLRL